MIFTGLSNNWALLQRVNAIENYLKENPIVPYAKASVAGEGTDTFVFNKSQLSVANGAGLMVGDLIICPDVTLWQVISIADSGEVTARFIVNFKGVPGAVGETPFAYLGGIIDTNTEPSAGKTVVLSNTDFSKTPKNGDRFVGFLSYNGVIYSATLAYLRPYIEGDNQTVFNYQDTQKITGEPGESGTVLYEHRIAITRPAHTTIYFNIYTRSATPLTYDTLASYISGKVRTATGWVARSSQIDIHNICVGIIANSDQLSAIIASGGQHIIDKENYTVTDTVEEI